MVLVGRDDMSTSFVLRGRAHVIDSSHRAAMLVRMRHFVSLAFALCLAACAATPASEQSAAAKPYRPYTPISAQGGPLAGFPQAPVTPALPTGPLTRIGLTSCSNEERPQAAFDALRAVKPDLVIMAGDNVYGSWTPEDPQLSDLRSSYFQQARKREFAALVSETPTLAVWDDHDYGKNDSGGDFAYKELAQQMFDAFWRIGPGHPQAHPNGVYGSWIIGPTGQRTQIILLDTRYWRSPLKPTDERNAPGKERYLPDDSPNVTMLGDAQWAWLEGELKKPAELRLIVSSVQIAAEGHGWERWGNFPRERQRFFDLVKSTGAKGVVVLSGDRHYSSINVAGRETVGYPIYDLTASAINMPWTVGAQEAGPNRVAGPYWNENFGLVSIDWAGKALTLEVRDDEGAPAFSRVVAFAEIGAGSL